MGFADNRCDYDYSRREVVSFEIGTTAKHAVPLLRIEIRTERVVEPVNLKQF